MIWENLKKNLCPYCESFLMFDGDKEINCTSCRFHIDPARFKSMVEHQSTVKKIVKLRWQNLRIGRCPECGSDLKDGVGQFEISVCVRQPECTFKIRQDKYMAILADPMHPVHHFEI